MPKIHLTTFIPAPAERVFDLSRNISLHKISMKHHREEAVAGVTSGLINNGETVTWRARHFFKTRTFTSKITEMKPYEKFVDKMVDGDFKSYEHEHYFKRIDNGTIVIDIVHFESPYGFIGKIFNKLVLKKYLERMITERNNVISQYAAGDKWKALKIDEQ